MSQKESPRQACYVCGALQLPGSVGWEIEPRSGWRLCPKHRSKPALATLGELIAAKEKARHGHQSR